MNTHPRKLSYAALALLPGALLLGACGSGGSDPGSTTPGGTGGGSGTKPSTSKVQTILSDTFTSDPTLMDSNGDGVMDWVIRDRESEHLAEITVYATTLAINYMQRGKFIQP